MSIQTVTTILSSSATAPAQLNAAISFARACGAHLQVVPIGIGFDQLGLVQGALDTMPMAISLEQAQSQVIELSELAKAQLSKEDIRWDIEPFTTFQGGLAPDIARHIRFSDLVVQQRPEDATEGIAGKVAEAVIFDADAPLLMLPAGSEMTAPAKTIMVAWDESAAALRAARLAMPFLAAAERVHVAVVDPAKNAPDRSDPGGAFAQFLARHGVKCEVSVMTRTGDSIAETLGQRAQEMGCDMLVMGAYGHSRLRQYLFGGTTRSMLEHAKLPVLFAH